MLNSAENKIYSAYKKLNTNNLKFFSCKAELSMNFSPANEHSNAKNCWKISCFNWVEKKKFYDLRATYSKQK